MFNAKFSNAGLICSFILLAAIVAVASHKTQKFTPPPPWPKPDKPRSPAQVDIGEYVSGHQSYEELISTFREWEKKAPDLVEIGTYGKTTKGIDHYYIRICNEFAPADKSVLLTACIHGNEPWSTSTSVASVGKILASYGKDKELTDLVNSRTIYLIPVVSPDSYPGSRGVDGVDPNKNFPTLADPDRESVAPVKNLQEFFLKIKPNGVLAGHTYGRVFLIPWGDSTSDNPNLADYERVASEMSKLATYRYQRACQMYNRPIYGTEIDWYHRNGAFAMVIEFGSHQRKPSLEDTRSELDRTFPAIVHFIKNSAEVEIK
jgi:hypothetical protein